MLLWGVGVQSVEAVASVGLAGCAVGVLAEAAQRREALDLRGFLRTWAPLLAFVLWALLAGPLNGRLPSGTGVARLADWLAIPVAARAFTRLGPARSRTLALAFGATFLLSCAVAGLQHFGVWPSAETFAPLAWTRFPFYRVYEPVPDAPGRFMAGGLLSHRLKFAHVGGLAVLFALGLGLAARGTDRAMALVLAGLGFVSVLFFPYARAAAGALAVSGVVVLTLAHPRRKVGLAIGAAVLLVAGAGAAAYGPMRARFARSFSSEGSGERDKLLATGVRAVSEHPVAGVGLGQFRPSRYSDASTPQAVRDNAGKAHNQFLSIAAEVGVPGLLLFLVALIFLGRAMRPATALGAAGIGALVFFALLSLTHDPLFQAPFSMALPLCLGAAVHPERRP
ncbi:MAG: O-antigen ligase family protein [Myxococcaceae bacterium]